MGIIRRMIRKRKERLMAQALASISGFTLAGEPVDSKINWKAVRSNIIDGGIIMDAGLLVMLILVPCCTLNSGLKIDSIPVIVGSIITILASVIFVTALVIRTIRKSRRPERWEKSKKAFIIEHASEIKATHYYGKCIYDGSRNPYYYRIDFDPSPYIKGVNDKNKIHDVPEINHLGRRTDGTFDSVDEAKAVINSCKPITRVHVGDASITIYTRGPVTDLDESLSVLHCEWFLQHEVLEPVDMQWHQHIIELGLDDAKYDSLPYAERVDGYDDDRQKIITDKNATMKRIKDYAEQAFPAGSGDIVKKAQELSDKIDAYSSIIKNKWDDEIIEAMKHDCRQLEELADKLNQLVELDNLNIDDSLQDLDGVIAMKKTQLR